MQKNFFLLRIELKKRTPSTMCIGMCIVLFIELKFYLYINTLIQFIDSYYRTILTSPQGY
ncbi:hypothetical protein DJ494_21425 [Klebsiella pneumoniae]|nr:hypothetical protein C4Y62_014785 [Klebsiella pneumoniae subsp. pneumoniae]TYD54160.1 hypothetical protein DJ505_23750 [Klebsiella pneumoniae]TYE22911.1 hypothetical protein DJ494_21425 [Klebsiella pneumoniae]TYE23183.1 hypothetical protein DJ512_21275 [Klebsiella pneumoniae]HBX3299175.1 hypothetical protein [Klebsiella pneumoniae]